MLVDNFDAIRPHLDFSDNDPSKFYFIQVGMRSKDNHNMIRYYKPIKSFYVFSLKDYDRYKSEIIFLCNHYNARSCISMNKLSMKDVAEKAKSMIDENLRRGGQWYKSCRHVMDTACVAYYVALKDNPYYIVDIDEKDKVDEISSYLKSLNLFEFTVPTVAGDHIVINTYSDQHEFFDKFHDIDVSIMPYCQVLLYSNTHVIE